VNGYLIIFGAMFSGIPMMMLAAIIFGNGAPQGFARIVFIALPSLFIAIGLTCIWYGIFGRLGSTLILARDGRLTTIRKFFLIAMPKTVDVKPGDRLRVVTARQRASALAGLKRVVIVRTGAGDIDIIDGVDEPVARQAAEKLSAELGLAVETSAQSGSDDPGGEESDPVVVAPIDRTERQRDVALDSTALYHRWKATVLVAVIIDAIISGVAVTLFATGVLSLRNFVPLLFVGIFGIVALIATAVAVRHAMIAMRLEPPMVTLSVSPLLLGESFEMEYRQKLKSPCRIEGVSARLFLKETAQYRRG